MPETSIIPESMQDEFDRVRVSSGLGLGMFPPEVAAQFESSRPQTAKKGVVDSLRSLLQCAAELSELDISTLNRLVEAVGRHFDIEIYLLPKGHDAHARNKLDLTLSLGREGFRVNGRNGDNRNSGWVICLHC